MANNRMYKTLPPAFRGGRGESPSASPEARDPGRRRTAGENNHSPQPFFAGLNLNLGISNLISGGMNFLGQLRRKTPSTTPVHGPAIAKASFTSSASGSRSSSLSSDVLYYDAPCGEQIELCSFPCLPEAAGEGQTGEGHHFEPVGSFNPHWCDLCGDLIWGLYDTGASKCDHCHFTCHVKCQRRVRLNCSILNSDLNKAEPAVTLLTQEDPDEATLANISSLKNEMLEGDEYEDCKTLKNIDDIRMDHDESSCHEVASILVNDLPLDSEPLFGDGLATVVAEYNAISPPGQETCLENGSTTCRGFIRVQLNLRRPINVISGTRPPSIYNIMKDDTVDDRTLTSFYLPSDTVKALHVTTDTTTRDVIRSLLDKFRVADTPYKYAMYEKTLRGSERDDDDQGKTLSRVRMRKLKHEERPLVLALLWCKEGVSADKCFVLQENDPGDVSWDCFSVPELKNFLLILDREEAWYKKRIHDKFEAVREHMNDLVKQKRRPSRSDEDL